MEVHLAQLRVAAQGCRGCELYRNATQAVLGEGPVAARIVMVGEQPGDKEDLAGRPFVGPAARILNRALEDAGARKSTSPMPWSTSNSKTAARPVFIKSLRTRKLRHASLGYGQNWRTFARN